MADGTVPTNRVDQYGGHIDTNQTLSDMIGNQTTLGERAGFAIVPNPSGSVRVPMNSRSLNGPNFGDRTVPEAIQPGILDAVEESTERPINVGGN